MILLLKEVKKIGKLGKYVGETMDEFSSLLVRDGTCLGAVGERARCQLA